MELLQCLLIDGLDRHGPDVRAARRFDQGRGIGRVGLVAPDVGTDILGGQKHHLMSLTTQTPGVMMSRAAGLHDHPACSPVHKEAIEPGAAEALPLDNMPAFIGQGDLEDVFCQVHTDSRSIHGRLLLLGLADATHPAWHIDAESLRQEESISSLERTRER